MFEDLRDNNQVFSGMFCRFPATVNDWLRATMRRKSPRSWSPAHISRHWASGQYLGRTIGPDDDSVPDSKPVVVLSYSFWRSYFNGDPTSSGGPSP
jgi:hypothetical protein